MPVMFLCSECNKFNYLVGGMSGEAEGNKDPNVCIACAEKMVKCPECGYLYSKESMVENQCYPCYVEKVDSEGAFYLDKMRA